MTFQVITLLMSFLYTKFRKEYEGDKLRNAALNVMIYGQPFSFPSKLCCSIILFGFQLLYSCLFDISFSFGTKKGVMFPKSFTIMDYLDVDC